MDVLNHDKLFQEIALTSMQVQLKCTGEAVNELL